MTPCSDLAGNAQTLHGAQAHAEKDEREFLLNFFQGYRFAHHRLAKFHAQRADHFHFAQAVLRAQFVFGHAIGIQSAGERPIVERR